QDFYCTNPDKTLVDRAAFLKQTATPVKLRNLRAEDVKIRVLGDFAIIHAATRYTTPEGEQACGRYTDCWARQNGRLLALAAQRPAPRSPCGPAPRTSDARRHP